MAGMTSPANARAESPASGGKAAPRLAELTSYNIEQLLQTELPDQTPKALAIQPDTATEMVLEASVNGTPTGVLLTVERSPDGGFSGKAGELRGIRIKVDPKLGAEDEVAYSDLRGVDVRYDEARQAIAFRIPEPLLDPYEVSLGGERAPTDLGAVHSSPGAMVNYDVSITRSGGQTWTSGDVEGLAMTPFGNVSTTALFDSQNSYGGRNLVRLDSSWQLVDPRAVRSYTLGDFASNALSWTGSVRLAGFQIASAFDQRPDIVTTALPQFSGSAALPSTLDLFVNQQKIFSGEIPSGPFDLKSLPYVSGGDVKLVTTDATGRQIAVTSSYYYVAGQLKKGLLEYSLDVGAPRLGYGAQSFHYDNTVFASGSVRYGLDGKLTLEGHAETSADGLFNGGFGFVKSVGGHGAITASIAGSHYKSRNGGKASVQLEGIVWGIRLFAGTDRTFGEYFDLSRVSISRVTGRLARDSALAPLTATLASTAQASIIDRAGLSFTPWFDKTSISLSYNRITTSASEIRTGSLSLSRGLGGRLSLFGNGYMNLDHSRAYGLYATLNVRLGRNVTVSAGASHDNGQTGYSFQATGSAGQRQGAIGWGVSDQEYVDAAAQRSAYVTWRAPIAQLRAEVDQRGSQWRGSAEISGSLVAAGGGVYAADRIGQAFAIIKNAGPHAEILEGGVRMGQANGAGGMLLPDITPYYEQSIFVDPSTLPDGWEPAATERRIVSAYRQGTVADFGARLVHGAVLILHDKNGKPIPPGYTVQLENGTSTVVGYDGQAYLEDLHSDNRITVDLGVAGTCSASFAYDTHGAAQPQIGPLTCQ